MFGSILCPQSPRTWLPVPTRDRSTSEQKPHHGQAPWLQIQGSSRRCQGFTTQVSLYCLMYLLFSESSHSSWVVVVLLLLQVIETQPKLGMTKRNVLGTFIKLRRAAGPEGQLSPGLESNLDCLSSLCGSPSFLQTSLQPLNGKCGLHQPLSL